MPSEMCQSVSMAQVPMLSPSQFESQRRGAGIELLVPMSGCCFSLAKKGPEGLAGCRIISVADSAQQSGSEKSAVAAEPEGNSRFQLIGPLVIAAAVAGLAILS